VLLFAMGMLYHGLQRKNKIFNKCTAFSKDVSYPKFGLCAANGLIWRLLTSFLLQVSAGTHDPDLARNHISRRDALLAGISSVAAAQALSPAHAPAAQSANLDPVTPVNITPKETVELGQSGEAKGSEPIKDGMLGIVVYGI
jgi:hypothetical protein